MKKSDFIKNPEDLIFIIVVIVGILATIVKSCIQ